MFHSRGVPHRAFLDYSISVVDSRGLFNDWSRTSEANPNANQTYGRDIIVALNIITRIIIDAITAVLKILASLSATSRGILRS